MIHDAISLGLFGAHIVVAIRVFFDLFGGFARVLGNRVIQRLAPADDFTRLDRDVGSLSAGTTGWLVNHHAAVRQSEALALGATSQKHRAHAGRHADAVSNEVT